jgi:RNA polymerase sigma factor (sigma-70 family)
MSAALAAAPLRWEDADRSRARAVREARVEGSDAELLARTGSGAQAAFGEVVRRHSGPLYAVAYRRLESSADAEEIVQDAFVLLWRKRARVHLVGDSALPWLIVTVKHLAANRSRARMRRDVHEREAQVAAATSIDPDTERGEAADLLRRAFAALPEKDAAVARLCLVEDVTYAEAAARLGMTEGAVRNRLSRARARLRRDLEDGR